MAIKMSTDLELGFQRIRLHRPHDTDTASALSNET